MLGSTLVAFHTSDIWLTKALASLEITVLVDRAFRVTVAGLKKHSQFQDFKGTVLSLYLVLGQINFSVDYLPDILEQRIRNAGHHTGCILSQQHLVYMSTGLSGHHRFR